MGWQPKENDGKTLIIIDKHWIGCGYSRVYLFRGGVYLGEKGREMVRGGHGLRLSGRVWHVRLVGHDGCQMMDDER